MALNRYTAYLAVFLIIGMIGCSGSSSDSKNVKVTEVSLGRSIGPDKQITDNTDSFRPSDTIYVSIHTEGSASNTTVKTRWTFQNGQLVNESEQTIIPKGSAFTEFHVSKPDPWPPGEYKVEVSINGSPIATKTFKVV